MHDVYHVDHVYMIEGSNIHFHVKHIAQVKFSTKCMLNTHVYHHVDRVYINA